MFEWYDYRELKMNEYDYYTLNTNQILGIARTNKSFKVRLKDTGKRDHIVNEVAFTLSYELNIIDLDIIVHAFDQRICIDKLELMEITKQDIQNAVIKLGKQILMKKKLER